jgi:ElaB/YqjD/DUF883 family membrane-anchored ribosome-binding protein
MTFKETVMAKEMMKDAQKEITSKARSAVSPIREDIDTIREDIKVLKDDAAALGRDLKVEGRKQYEVAEERAGEMLDSAKEYGKQNYTELLSFVRGNPGQSIAIAFVGGMVASLLLGRRG